MSQCARILDVLSDGAPHTVQEIHSIAGYSRLNSRVSELRARGFVIESFHVPGKQGSEGYGYQLISAGEPCSSEPSPPLPLAHREVVASPAVQLELV